MGQFELLKFAEYLGYAENWVCIAHFRDQAILANVYSPAICVGAKKVPITGTPDPKHISTSFSERNNLNVRMHSRRMTRLTNAFSKKLENHYYAMSLHFLYYNFVRVHQTLKMTPAMAAGVSKRLWEMKDVVEMLEA
jgi:hypothetical protein